jgi:hypothetical protein
MWWSGKHQQHGGNIQVVSAPDGWPLWTSDVGRGREHDTTCARHHDILSTIAEAAADDCTSSDSRAWYSSRRDRAHRGK